MNTLCTALILLARVAGGEVAIPAHQIAAVEDAAAGAIVTTERGAAWRVSGTARDVAERVRDGCLVERGLIHRIDQQGSQP
ncbi:hypothetical protein METUNv1_00551 [Methyloversatilis universalis FAM5]|uniref:Uncharacterized protein n=1 Tax=Methyloversatilis universalis (strain ATCC BAA-1314 / DSM 25237 / JCM 13912 / CCUG 52030 / FAM5) TaxID=1000565 RepID=F5R8J5_METUF|nr:hypothetical protein [Methyloversatilis universalis]EGK73373.1 hypothetical protein METUNv1_00551 [Methyloversatilis universalis FAM5]